jgi:ferredoxin-like protein FixX
MTEQTVRGYPENVNALEAMTYSPVDPRKRQIIKCDCVTCGESQRVLSPRGKDEWEHIRCNKSHVADYNVIRAE